MRVIASYPEWKNTPIILGESDPEGCAACTGPQNAYRNGPLYGVSVTEATMRIYELARRNGLNVKGAVTWAFEFENEPAFAGFRSLATDGIDKAVLNAFRMMGMLGAGKPGAQWVKTSSDGARTLDEILTSSVTGAPDVNAVATRNGDEVDVLLWNYHDADVKAPPAEIHMQVKGLAGSKAMEAEFRMDATHSNAYRVWLEMGSPAQPTPAQKRELEQAGRLQQTAEDHALPVRDGKLSVSFALPRQGVMLVRLRER